MPYYITTGRHYYTAQTPLTWSAGKVELNLVLREIELDSLRLEQQNGKLIQLVDR